MRSRMSGTDELGTITVQKHGRVSAGMSAKTTTTHSRGTWTVFCYSKQDNWVCSFQVTRMQTVFMHVYLCAWELVLINYSGSSWWSFRLILWLFDVWQLQHLNLIRRFVWVSLWTAAQLELHQSSEQSLVQPLRPPLYQI